MTGCSAQESTQQSQDMWDCCFEKQVEWTLCKTTTENSWSWSEKELPRTVSVASLLSQCATAKVMTSVILKNRYWTIVWFDRNICIMCFESDLGNCEHNYVNVYTTSMRFSVYQQISPCGAWPETHILSSSFWVSTTSSSSSSILTHKQQCFLWNHP